MCISLPNMQKWLEKRWSNCLNFEHTLLLTEAACEFLFARCGFVLSKKCYFRDHSIFYRLKKGQITNPKLENAYARNKNLFLDMIGFYKERIARLNETLGKQKEIYLFGAHLFSQYLLYQGLRSEGIVAILDNNTNKQGQRLYGTKLFVQSPQILRHKDKALVILAAGAYNDEIERQLLSINAGVEIVKF